MVENHTDAPQLFMIGADHRVDFCKDLVGSKDTPTAEEREQAATLKRVVFDGLVSAIESGLPKSQAAIWTDPDIGEGVLLRAKAMSLGTAASVENPGNGLGLSDVSGAWEAINRLDTTFAAARISYNSGAPLAEREASQAQLRALTERCRESNRQLLIELTPVPTKRQLEEYGDESVQSVLLIEGIRQLQDAGVEPQVWAFEPPAERKAAATITAQAYVDDRTSVTVLFMVGSDPDPDRITVGPRRSERAVARLAARTTGVGGLLIGPQAYFGQLARLQQGAKEHDEAASGIASHIRKLWELFVEARHTSDVT
ncbi:MAG: DUF2090 domain-containing protein [Dehalococcoidia bacterium]